MVRPTIIASESHEQASTLANYSDTHGFTLEVDDVIYAFHSINSDTDTVSSADGRFKPLAEQNTGTTNANQVFAWVVDDPTVTAFEWDTSAWGRGAQQYIQIRNANTEVLEVGYAANTGSATSPQAYSGQENTIALAHFSSDQVSTAGDDITGWTNSYTELVETNEATGQKSAVAYLDWTGYGTAVDTTTVTGTGNETAITIVIAGKFEDTESDQIIIPRKTFGVSGRRIYARTFNGVSAQVDGGNQMTYRHIWINRAFETRLARGPISFAAWGFIDAADATTNDWCCMQIQDEDVSSDYIRFGLTDTGDSPGGGHVRYMWQDSGVTNSTFSSAATEIQPRTWFHMAATDTETEQVCYLDGGNTDSSSWDRTALSIDGANSITIGRENDSSSTDTWLGAILWPAVWKVALTPTEIAWLAGGMPPWLVRPESLIFFAPLDGRSEDLRDRISGEWPVPMGGGSGAGATYGTYSNGFKGYTGEVALAGYEEYNDFLIIPKDKRKVVMI